MNEYSPTHIAGIDDKKSWQRLFAEQNPGVHYHLCTDCGGVMGNSHQPGVFICARDMDHCHGVCYNCNKERKRYEGS